MSTPGTLMLQGTGSNVGKSLMVAGLCRLFTRRGLRVRPFKPQNMSNNAAVTADGGEIGRAQALQALACGVPLSVHMNPVLLKPEAETGAQIIVQGERVGSARARDYGKLKSKLLPRVLESFERLKADADLVLIEGAGSPAEINLRKGDIANMGFAEAADVPVALIADIDRGGVIANLVGTHAVLTDAESERVAGFIINKFRGDVSLFEDGNRAIAERTGWQALGVVPWFNAARKLPAEDSVGLAEKTVERGGKIRIAVPVLARIANHDDLDPLSMEPDVDLILVERGASLPGDVDLVILPGSKSTIGDLEAFRDEGWDIDLQAHLRRGGHVLGLCGGYQMLGNSIADPDGVEGPSGETVGLGCLDVSTRLATEKRLEPVSGRHLASDTAVSGYEMHMGETHGDALARPFLEIGGQREGAISEDGRVIGTYVHGIFAADDFRHAFLSTLRDRDRSDIRYDAAVEATLDALADHLDAVLDIDTLAKIANVSQSKYLPSTATAPA